MKQLSPGDLPMMGALDNLSVKGAHDLPDSVREVIGLLRQDMLHIQVQEQILEAMTPSARRTLVHKVSGLDASILETFKKQIRLVDNALRRLVNDDGSPASGADEAEMSLKDAMNLSLKVTQILVRDLPKIYTIERIQRQEEALRIVMEQHMTVDQQDKVLEALEKLEAGAG